MKVILNQNVEKLGYRGDVVNVKSGYFRNYLLPRGFAQIATERMLKTTTIRNEKRVLQKERLVEKAKEVLAKLKGLTIKIKAKVSAKGKLYGSIGEEEIIEAVKKSAKVELEKQYIKMDPIKALGEHKVTVHLGEKLEETIKIEVEAVK